MSESEHSSHQQQNLEQKKREDKGVLWNLTPEQEEEEESHQRSTVEGGEATTTTMTTTNPSWSGILSHVPKKLLGDPRMVLRHVRKFVTIDPVPQSEIMPPENPPPKPEGHLRLVCISDTHTHHGRIPHLPPGDVLIHGGDFTDIGLPRDIDAFCSWLGNQNQYKQKIVIAGNHDLSLDPDSYPETWKRFGHSKQFDVQEQIAKIKKVSTYLDHEGCEIEGVRFFGSPYQPWFYDWAFNLQRVNECRRMWESLPRPPLTTSSSNNGGGLVSPPSSASTATATAGCAVDVLITHGPPLGHGDMVRGGSHAGCIDLLDYVEAFPPKVHIFGHIHEGYGLTRNDKGTVFINASTMNVHYDSNNLNPAVVWDVPIPNYTNSEKKKKSEGDQ